MTDSYHEQVRQQLADAQGALAALREQHLADARDANAKLRSDIEALQLLNGELNRLLSVEQKRTSRRQERLDELEAELAARQVPCLVTPPSPLGWDRLGLGPCVVSGPHVEHRDTDGATWWEKRAACPDPVECGHEAALGQAEARIAAVRALHRPSMSGRDCESCCDYSGDPLPWPCPTIAAIDGPAEQPTCCVCGTTESGGREFYENYRGKLFCWPCADGDRLCDCHQPPIRASQHDPGLQPDLDKLAELARLEARVRAKLSTIGMTMVFTDPIEQLAAAPATLAQLNDRWPQGPVNGISAYPLVPDDTLPPGEVHLRPHPRTADGPS